MVYGSIAQMASKGSISFKGNAPLTHEHLQEITSYLHHLDDSESSTTHKTGTGACTSLEPLKPEQICHLFQFLDEQYWSTTNSSPDADKNSDEIKTRRRPILLNICSGNGLVPVAASHFNLCSQSVGLDTNQLKITSSKRLAFQQKVFDECHFFHTELTTVNPKLLLNNPHFMADKINDADVVFLYAYPVMIKELIPLLALLSFKKRERKFVTLLHHLPNDFAVGAKLISGTELCVYDGVIDDRMKQVEPIMPPPPEPVDRDEIDKEFARSSIRLALPERF